MLTSRADAKCLPQPTTHIPHPKPKLQTGRPARADAKCLFRLPPRLSPLISFSYLLLSSLELSDTKVYEPYAGVVLTSRADAKYRSGPSVAPNRFPLLLKLTGVSLSL